jgi:hypothetical protein
VRALLRRTNAVSRARGVRRGARQFLGLKRSIERRHQPGIRLKQQRRCEEQRSLNHHVYSFWCLNQGVHPLDCDEIVLNSIETHRIIRSHRNR